MASNANDSSSSRALNCVQDYLNKTHSRLMLRDIPSLSSALLKRARNCVKHSFGNNDLLEFIGDRAVNLFAAVMVGRVKLNKAHHSAVRSTVCNNDTLGRVSFSLHLHYRAELERKDIEDVDKWNPLSADQPPKVLADLFEAYAGAVYTQHGWTRLELWLDKLFLPIVKAATGDFWLTISPEQLLGASGLLRRKTQVPETKTQSKLLDYIEFKCDVIKSGGSLAVDLLPKSTKYRFDRRSGRLQEPDTERVEVAVHLINMWICQVVIQLWPEYHAARAKAAHMLSAITGLITSERVMAYLATTLSLDTFHDTVQITASHGSSSPDSDGCSSSSNRDESRPSSRGWRPATPVQRAVMLKATIGWVYHVDPDATMKWGEQWFKPIVVRAHDILVEHGYRPVIPKAQTQDKCSSVPLEDPVAALSSQLSGLLHLEEGPKRRDQATTSDRRPSPISTLFIRDDVPPALPNTGKPASRPKTLQIVVHSKSATTHSSPHPEPTSLEKLANDLSSLSLTAGKQSCEEPKVKGNTKTSAGDHQSAHPEHKPISKGDGSTPSVRHVSDKWKPINSGVEKENKSTGTNSSAIMTPPLPRPLLHSTDSDKTTTPHPPPLHTIPTNRPTRLQVPIITSESNDSENVPPSKAPVSTATMFLPRSIRAKVKHSSRNISSSTFSQP